jgi:hypothetical protein
MGAVMKVLVACEYSGLVRDAFISRGHDALSCDLLPTEGPGPHYQGDVFDIIEDGWDLMVAHPPCTHLSVSGARWWPAKRADGRQQSAVEFFMRLAAAPIERVAIENPIGFMSTSWRKPDQIIQPWQFGQAETKTTCLWLKNLPALVPTKIMEESYSCACGVNFPLERGKYGCPNCGGRNKVVRGYGHKSITKGGRVLPKWYNLPPSPDRGKKRSATFPGIAAAMADQWGRL